MGMFDNLKKGAKRGLLLACIVCVATVVLTKPYGVGMGPALQLAMVACLANTVLAFISFFD